MGEMAGATSRVTLALNMFAAPCAFRGLRDRFLAETAATSAAATMYPGIGTCARRGGRGFRR